MNTTLIITAATLIILLSFSAFFSASETALSSISKVQLRQLKKSKTKKDRLLVKILTDPSRMLTTLLIGNNIVNIWSSSIATAFAISLFGNEAIGISTLIMTVIIVIFSEITPKTFATNDPSKLARTIAPAVDIVQRLLFPLVFLFSGMNFFLIKILKRFSPGTSHLLTEDELKTMMDVGKREGILEAREHALLKKAFDFTELKLREIMTPRTEIAAINIDSGIEEICEQFKKHQFSRMPVFTNSIDSIQGMIHYKDILFLRETKKEYSLQNLIRPVLFVPESQSTFDLLQEMEYAHQNMAVIIDEHGGTSGLVTIDDALAAVFGGIHDEYDQGETEPLEMVQILDASHLIVPGDLKLADLNALLKTDLDSDYYETVGGFIMETAGKLPSRGDRIRYNNILFQIDKQTNRKIQLVTIRLDLQI